MCLVKAAIFERTTIRHVVRQPRESGRGWRQWLQRAYLQSGLVCSKGQLKVMCATRCSTAFSPWIWRGSIIYIVYRVTKGISEGRLHNLFCCIACKPSRQITQKWRRYYVKTMSFWCKYVKMTSSWHNNDVIITSWVQGENVDLWDRHKIKTLWSLDCWRCWGRLSV